MEGLQIALHALRVHLVVVGLFRLLVAVAAVVVADSLVFLLFLPVVFNACPPVCRCACRGDVVGGGCWLGCIDFQRVGAGGTLYALFDEEGLAMNLKLLQCYVKMGKELGMEVAVGPYRSKHYERVG